MCKKTGPIQIAITSDLPNKSLDPLSFWEGNEIIYNILMHQFFNIEWNLLS